MHQRFQVKVRLTACQALADLNGVRGVADVLADNGYVPARRTDDGLVAAADPGSRLFSSLIEWPGRTASDPFGFPKTSFASPIMIKNRDEIICSLGCDFFCSTHSVVQLGGLVSLRGENPSQCVEAFAQDLRRMALTLCAYLRPAHAYVDESFASRQRIRDVVRVRIKTISWFQIFGPAYVDKYGDEFLLGIPGFEAWRFSDHGIAHQLSPTFVVADAKQGRRIQKQAKDYFTAAGIAISCTAPYTIAVQTDS